MVRVGVLGGAGMVRVGNLNPANCVYLFKGSRDPRICGGEDGGEGGASDGGVLKRGPHYRSLSCSARLTS